MSNIKICTYEFYNQRNTKNRLKGLYYDVKFNFLTYDY